MSDRGKPEVLTYMPLTDFFQVLRWWGTLFLVGSAAYPLAKRLFPNWHDTGYFFAKAIGLATVTWVVYVLGMAKIAPFTVVTIFGAIISVFVVGILLQPGIGKGEHDRGWKKTALTIITEEAIFLVALLYWSWIKAHEPSLRGLEKFMDYGFMQSALRSTFFPPPDMWYPPYPVNYYYFGHLVTALITKLSGLDLMVTFNVMLSTIFALCLTMSYSIGFQLMATSPLVAARKRFFAAIGGALTAYLVTLSGNMQTIYAFTKGYTGEDVAPFWTLLWKWSEFLQRLPEGLERYWYANATRFIPFTIHEFPSYSFVVSDIHGHVLSIPFVLLALGLIIAFVQSLTKEKAPADGVLLGMYGFLVGVLLMTNALDGPIYFGLLVLVFVAFAARQPKKTWKQWGLSAGLVLLVAALTSLPFLLHFKSFVNGVAVNCPIPFFAHSRIGPLLFEGVEKCQRSPLWMLWVLWGFFWFCGGLFLFSKVDKIKYLRDIKSLWNTKFTHTEHVLLLFFFFAFALIIFPEFFYFKDIYPQHFRSNTMFKLGYQAFIMWSIMSSYAIVHFFLLARARIASRGRQWAKKILIILLIPQLFFVVIYPGFSVPSYFGKLRQYEGLNGSMWLAREYPDDYAAILWLRQQQVPDGITLVEADGDSYTDYERFSVFTGIPTIIGWAVHEWLWRGTYDAVSPRREDVGIIYESEDIEETRRILDQYNVQYIIVGTLEREKYPNIAEWKFAELGDIVYQSGETVIYGRTN